MLLEEKIMADYKEAMKARDTAKTQALSFLRSHLKNIGIDKKKDKLDDADVTAVLKKQIKQRQDSIEQFEKGGRTELVEKEKAELNLLKSYLPPEMSQVELAAIIKETIISTGAASPKDMGRVMKEVLEKTKGAADGKMVSNLVRELLNRNV